LLLPALWCSAALAGIGYVGSASGLVLQAVGEGAVTGTWRGQSPIQGFSGYGQVHWNGLCLSARHAGEQLRWEGCRIADRAQIWKLANERLANELGHCARRQHEAEAARVLAAACSSDAAQRWKSFSSTPAEVAAGDIASPVARSEFLRIVAAVPAGTVISLSTGHPVDPRAVVAGQVAGPKVMNLGAGVVMPLPARH
jgi:hypothetical protein